MRFKLAGGAVCALLMLNLASAQNPVVMPGQVVSTGTVNPVGQKAPMAAAPVGSPVTSNMLMRPYDPNRPYDMFKGTNIDTKQILAPLVGPNGQMMQEPSTLDKMVDKLKSLVGLKHYNPPPRPPFTPGILRRNRERAEEQMWRRD